MRIGQAIAATLWRLDLCDPKDSQKRGRIEADLARGYQNLCRKERPPHRHVITAVVACAWLTGCAETRITYAAPDGPTITYTSGKDQDWSIVLPDGHEIRVKGTASTVEAARWATVVEIANVLRSLAPQGVP